MLEEVEEFGILLETLGEPAELVKYARIAGRRLP